MRLYLPLLCLLGTAPVRGIFEGACLMKEPPPGVLVLSPGSKLSLTCSGDVRVNERKVVIATDGSNQNARGTSAHAITTTTNVISNTGVSVKSAKQTVEHGGSEGHYSNSSEAGESRSLGHTDAGHTTSPTTEMAPLTSVGRPLKADVKDGEDDDDEEVEEEGREGSRVTRGIKLRPQWKWNERTVRKGDRGIVFEERGTKLSLSSVKPTDSGRYTCYYRGRERFSLKVIAADPPERPHLSCYKRSHGSKIRCEWEPQQPVTLLPTVYLLLRKGMTDTRFNCSYSARRSRFWCALDYVEDDRRVPHKAYLCVTSIAGNTTSELLHFTPLSILKPDPPSNVKVLPMEGQETRLMVTWRSPISWKSPQNLYYLSYEIQYKPLISSIHHYQMERLENLRSYIINDAMPGIEYMVQLRAKDEFDGQWSVWSTPVCNSSWIAPTTDTLPTEDLTASMEGSGTDLPDDSEQLDDRVTVPHPILWISFSFIVLLIILAAYIFRHGDRFMSKLHSLSGVTQCSDPSPSQPAAPTVPEAQALVKQAPLRYKEPPPSEVEEREDREEDKEDQAEEWMETMHFNNTSYFFLQPQ